MDDRDCLAVIFVCRYHNKKLETLSNYLEKGTDERSAKCEFNDYLTRIVTVRRRGMPFA